ncbi:MULTISPECIES: hypothetical protein [unclassified Paenibacillus]|uniref:hypothetical protein n=1 Tax=unclassified Paenibacillus TaxID=185978 RepID=UPI000CFDCA39|nr:MULTISPECIES: hypothetical protein [unclassified Paenibacillus]MBD8836957.1 hypothetical protein [Paenibacillus sp. CFBP 13594]PRA07789.1 hypothetical protein CQ043_10545 [Paenibacillus sp. MYb63]PRA51434.1 hypothetical protein CQ061_03700 [Paenibacillus sp. MYb67]QZN74562.1 hypothetical protein K5K90_24705 [Paenibacillus sp. DR312]
MSVETHAGKVWGIVFVGHIKGIIPIDETEFGNGARLRDAVGTSIYYKVLQLDRNSAIFGASSKQSIDHLQGLTWDQLRENMVIEAKYSSWDHWFHPELHWCSKCMEGGTFLTASV